ncbi:MAG: aminomethyl-transferring glycine dehydrogenase subunit GcvPB [Candidatus Omnitrophica bacterium]|nr:aminomethyl-transferring glycine dehydrogenase subunit GcvPB [Candidatus Omnitrophota bacterium]
MEEKLIFEYSKPGKQGASLPCRDLSMDELHRFIPDGLKRKTDTALPEVSEPEVIRHFFRLSQKNFCVDTHFYPLGSCTMKYSPKVNEDLAALSGFTQVHPSMQPEHVQGILTVMYELEQYLCSLTGMKRFSFQPAAGAHAELTGMMLVKAYHDARGEARRSKVIVPDSSHGTNPASAAVYGYRIVEVKSNNRGRVNVDELKAIVDEECACLMLTNPNTLGLFEDDILEIADIVHQKGGLLYYDGANLNALMGLFRPADMGFDIIHLNLHKTFSTPHGGGGPGAGPLGVTNTLVDYLPIPLVEKVKDRYVLNSSLPKTIGKVKTFYGNVGVLIKAYCYIRSLGIDGLRRATEDAIINANYIKSKIKDSYSIPYEGYCMHEFVASAQNFKNYNVHAGDIGKRLLDYGFHAPTVSFPLIVPEALMIEPTETETKETLDAFVEALKKIADESRQNPDIVKNAPHLLERGRCDEVHAARFPNVCWK